MSVRYQDDVVAWAVEQVGWIRAGRFDLLELERIADEIEDVGKAELREFCSRMSMLLASLLRWRFLLDRRGAGLKRLIKEQRKAVMRRLEKTPSLKP